MEPVKISTQYAPAERASDREIERQRLLFQNVPLMDQLLDVVPKSGDSAFNQREAGRKGLLLFPQPGRIFPQWLPQALVS